MELGPLQAATAHWLGGMSVMHRSRRHLETCWCAHSTTWRKMIDYAHFQSKCFYSRVVLAPDLTNDPAHHSAAALWQWGLWNANTRVYTTQLGNPISCIASFCSTALLRPDPPYHLDVSFQHSASCHQLCHVSQHHEKLDQLSWQQALCTFRQVIWKMTPVKGVRRLLE